MFRIHKDTENLSKVDSSYLPPPPLLLESVGQPVLDPGSKHVTWMPTLQGRMASIHHSSATGVELSSRVLLYGGPTAPAARDLRLCLPSYEKY